MLEDPDEKQQMTDLADQARAWRKDIEHMTIGNGPDDENHNQGDPLSVEQLPDAEVRIYKEKQEFHAGSFRTIKPDEETLVLVGCPVERAAWQDQQCICHESGERGCMELHSITKMR